tara:strand:+ start:553 stop:687 length:135 start_codon:yes stop_codon:yes gene_type:complete
MWKKEKLDYLGPPPKKPFSRVQVIVITTTVSIALIWVLAQLKGF